MRKIIGFALALIMICSQIPNSLAIEADVSYSEENSASELIKAITNTEFKSGEETITRGNFVKLFVKLISKNSSGEAIQTSFTDIDLSDKELVFSVEYAADLGIISRMDTFRTSDGILFDEALKMCCSELGYDLFCQNVGGYPSGYRSVSGQNGLLKNLVFHDGTLTVEECVILLKNMLTAPYLEKQYTSDNRFDFKDNGKNLLEYLYDIHEVTGILSGNGYTYKGKTDLAPAECHVYIDGNSYNTDIDMESWLGYHVKAYVKDTEDGEIIVSVSDYNTRAVTLKSDDLIWKERGTLLEDENGKKYKVDKSCDVVYNGRYTEKGLTEFIGNITGEIVFIDNNNDNEYDVTIIREVNYMTVKTVSLRDMAVYGDNSNTMINIKNNAAYNVYDLVSGTELSFADIRTGLVIGVEKSLDEMRIKIYLYPDEESGTVEEISDEELTIDGNVYKSSRYFRDKYLSSVKAGAQIAFVKGLFGELVSMTQGLFDYEYGYLVKASTGDIPDDDTIYAKIFDKDGEMKYFKASDKFKIDGKKPKTALIALNTLKETADEGQEYAQLIKFKISGDELIGIDTAENGDDFWDSGANSENNNMKRYDFAESYRYRNYGTLFYPYFNSKNTIFFIVPSDRTIDDDYMITSTGYFSDETYRNLTPYDVASNGSAKAAVYITDNHAGIKNPTLSSTPCMVVEQVTETVDNDGEVCRAVSGWGDSSFKKFYIDNKVKISKKSGKTDLVTGDIILYMCSKDKITDIDVVFDADKETFAPDDTALFYNEWNALSYLDGKVYSCKDGYLYYSNSVKVDGNYDFGMKSLRHITANTKDVVEVNMKTGELRPSSTDNLLEYTSVGDSCDYFVLQYSYLYGYLMTVYKFD